MNTHAPSEDAVDRRRVLLCTNSVALGGLEEHVRLLAKYLDRSRFEVFAVTPEWQPTAPFSRAMSEVAEHAVEVTPDARYGRVNHIREAIRLGRLLRAWKIDTAHFHCTTFSGQSMAICIARIAGVREIFVTEHLAPYAGLPFFRGVYRNLVMTMVTQIVCVSEKNRAVRSKWLRTPPSRTAVVANGVDPNEFEPFSPDDFAQMRVEVGLPPGAQVVGTAVRFEPEKGLVDLVEAFAIVAQQLENVHLVLVGDGSIREILEEIVDKYGMNDFVHFVGFQSQPRPYIALMDVFVLPVPAGSMSIGLLEAMAMGCVPVITFGGEGEAVVHGESGYCAKPNDPASLAYHIALVLKDVDEARVMSAAARQRVLDHFSATRVAAQLGALYERTSRRNRRRSVR